MISEHKMKHILKVAELCYTIAKEKYNMPEEKARAMWVIGYNHDIGYNFMEPEDNPKIHPELGADAIKEAFHFDSDAIRCHGKCVNQNILTLRILNEADLKVDSHGNKVPVKERIEDIGRRYGKDSSQYEKAVWLAKELDIVDE